jgi:hypothetical protein
MPPTTDEFGVTREWQGSASYGLMQCNNVRTRTEALPA